ncbi:MAG: DUF58 domain-containing protein [Acidimicrobiales bacterium]|nr:DUF58 domain-containing protein [Acidimicrobiales bacterium]
MSSDAAGPLLEPALLARLEQLQLSTNRRLAGQFTGEHRSTRYGSSLDFADYREYTPGDDFRRIDYNLYARLDVLLLKLFEAEDDLTLRILLDTSASMGNGPKMLQAKRVAAALGFVALTRRDVVTVHTFPLDQAPPRFTGRHASHALFDYLAGLPSGGETQFAAAARHLLGRKGPPGLTVVISDLLTDEWEASISRLPTRGDSTVVVHVLDAEDIAPDIIGDVEVVDRETGERITVSMAPETLDAFRQGVDDWLESVALRCRQSNAGYVRVLDTDDVGDLLLTNWRNEGVLR